MTTDIRPTRTTRRPWHLWVVAIVGFAVYVGGARDYLCIALGDTDYIEHQFGSGGVGYFTGYPIALRALWTLNIVTGLLAPILLVARSRWTPLVALAGAVAEVVLLVLTFTLRDRWTALGPTTAFFDIAIALLTAAIAWYAWAVPRPDGRAD
ncbi:MAG TPA: hypothetical protein VF444_10300 [Pseudonocardiaceae bacterium]